MNKNGFQLTAIAAALILTSIGMAALLSGLTPEGDYIPTADKESSSATGSEIPDDNSDEDTGGDPAQQPASGGIKGGNKDALVSGRLPGSEDKDENPEPENSFWYSINSDVILESPEAEGNIMAENNPGNTHPMQLCYYLEDTEELVYLSPMIAPDEHVETDALSKKLKKGEYKINAVISVYDEETMELKTTFHEEVNLTVNQKFLGIF